MNDNKYIATITLKNNQILTVFASYQPNVRRCEISGEPVLENIRGLVRWADVLTVKMDTNPDYNKNTE